MNYRTIALVTIFSKTLETAVFNTLNHHLRVNNVMITDQFGFGKDSTIQNAVSTLTNNILTARNERNREQVFSAIWLKCLTV